MDFCKSVGIRLKKMRERKGITVLEVARTCGVKEYVIVGVEDGETIPNYALFDDWCRTLGTNVSAFMSAYKWIYIEPNEKGVVCCECAKIS